MADPLPLWKPPTPDEIPEAPEWLTRWMAPYNRQLTAITNALAGGLDERHELADVKEIEVRDGEMLEVRTEKVRTKPKGVQILATEFPIRAWNGRGIDIGALELTVYFEAPAPAGDVPITIKILG